MFDKKTFSKILTKIYKTYNNQRDFANAAEVNRAYLSQYMNEKLDNPPTPKILEKISNASNKVTTYDELMYVCGYIDYGFSDYNEIADAVVDMNITKDEWAYFWKDFYDLKLSYKESIALNKLEEQFYNVILNPKELNKNNIYNHYNKNIFDGFSQNEMNRVWKAFFIFADSFDFVNGRRNDKNYPMPTRNYFEIDEITNINNNSSTQFYMCPVYGQISAGQPNWAEECLTGYIPLDVNLMDIHNPEECFFLKVNGESMNKKIKNGSFALIHKQDIVEDGEIAVVLVNGYDATLKKFTRQGDLVILEPMSNDPAFTTQVYGKDTEIKILGKYIGKFEMNN